jgi:hypothetical protein
VTLRGEQGLMPIWLQDSIESGLALSSLTHEHATNWKQWSENIDRYLQLEEPIYFSPFFHTSHYQVEVAYTITRNSQITNAHLVKECDNQGFNNCVIKLVNSIAKLPFLQFPDGAADKSMDRTTVFTNPLWYDNLWSI